jgi:hypothetical protein
MKAGDKNEQEKGKNNENKTDETGKKTKDEDNTKNTMKNTFLTSTQIFTGMCEPSAINTVLSIPERRPTCAAAAEGCLAPAAQHAPRALSWVSLGGAQPTQRPEETLGPVSYHGFILVGFRAAGPHEDYAKDSILRIAFSGSSSVLRFWFTGVQDGPKETMGTAVKFKFHLVRPRSNQMKLWDGS